MAATQTANSGNKELPQKLSERKRKREKEFTKHFKLDLAKGMTVCDKLCRLCSSNVICANGSHCGLEKHVSKGCKKLPPVGAGQLTFEVYV